MSKRDLPEPVKVDGRTCFGISYFATEEEAERYSDFIKERGDRYNGGWFDGMPCGRDSGFDSILEDGRKLYAVTTR